MHRSEEGSNTHMHTNTQMLLVCVPIMYTHRFSISERVDKKLAMKLLLE